MKVDYLVDWPEVLAITFFFIGMIIAFFSGNFYILYAVSFLMGLLFGRVWYRQAKSNKVPLFFTIALFLLGMIVGSFFAWVRPVTLFLITGVIIAYLLHKKGIIESVEF